ncbi:hypothetical protein [Paenibacillus sp. KS-LC4]|uniref:hypothetical protein n=1 Tax=Paenibacillus sp. KS-LC4 TaxID=2979727 RepID=UPI0030D175DF
MYSKKSYMNSVDSLTIATFRALVEAIVPNTPALAMYGAEQAAGAVDLHIHEYMIWELDHSLSLFLGTHLTIITLAAPTAQLLNSGAVELVTSGRAQHAPNHAIWGSSPYAALSPIDRIRVLAMLEQLDVDLGVLQPPYQYNGGNVRFIVDFLTRQTMFGNYSEWSAYGKTRLVTPTERRLEYFPISWKQVGYPGVVPGYRALLGYKLTIVREGGKSTIV